MFSGLTNQVSSWMGSAKGEHHDEQVPTPTEDVNTVLQPEEGKDTSPTKSKFVVLSNVKNQFGGWIGSSLPKFRKNDSEAHPDGQPSETKPPEEDPSALLEKPPKTGDERDDDDNSSATGGADSGPGSGTGTPTEEAKDGQFGAVSNKALAGAKSIGSFLYSAVNKAGKTVSEAGAKIKKTVEENSILGEFNKEQEAFVKGQQKNSEAAVPPWVGCANEEALKEECLSLSTDRRNFVRSPPAGVDFQFDYDQSYQIAVATMAEDPNLEKMRFELVPKVISEESFWRNYFYRVSLICQANELTYMARDADNQSSDTGNESQQLVDQNDKKNEVSEFVSDNFQTVSDVARTEEDIKNLSIPDKVTSEEEWEKELEAELQDYEVVNEGNKIEVKNEFWDKDIDEMLDEGDLK